MSINPRRLFHLALFCAVFELVTILMSGGHVLPTFYTTSCNPLTLCGCEP